MLSLASRIPPDASTANPTLLSGKSQGSNSHRETLTMSSEQGEFGSQKSHIGIEKASHLIDLDSVSTTLTENRTDANHVKPEMAKCDGFSTAPSPATAGDQADEADQSGQQSSGIAAVSMPAVHIDVNKEAFYSKSQRDSRSTESTANIDNPSLSANNKSRFRGIFSFRQWSSQGNLAGRLSEDTSLGSLTEKSRVDNENDQRQMRSEEGECNEAEEMELRESLRTISIEHRQSAPDIFNEIVDEVEVLPQAESRTLRSEEPDKRPKRTTTSTKPIVQPTLGASQRAYIVQYPGASCQPHPASFARISSLDLHQLPLPASANPNASTLSSPFWHTRKNKNEGHKSLFGSSSSLSLADDVEWIDLTGSPCGDTEKMKRRSRRYHSKYMRDSPQFKQMARMTPSSPILNVTIVLPVSGKKLVSPGVEITVTRDSSSIANTSAGNSGHGSGNWVKFGGSGSSGRLRRQVQNANEISSDQFAPRDAERLMDELDKQGTFTSLSAYYQWTFVRTQTEFNNLRRRLMQAVETPHTCPGCCPFLYFLLRDVDQRLGKRPASWLLFFRLQFALRKSLLNIHAFMQNIFDIASSPGFQRCQLVSSMILEDLAIFMGVDLTNPAEMKRFQDGFLSTAPDLPSLSEGLSNDPGSAISVDSRQSPQDLPAVLPIQGIRATPSRMLTKLIDTSVSRSEPVGASRDLRSTQASGSLGSHFSPATSSSRNSPSYNTRTTQDMLRESVSPAISSASSSSRNTATVVRLCFICSNNLDASVTRLPCGHKYHDECILDHFDKAIKKELQCPQCSHTMEG